MQKIGLNFIPLTDQCNMFLVYRLNVPDGSAIKNEDEYRTKLPSGDSDDEWSLYDISLVEKEGYEQFNCQYSTNRFLTEYYLFYLLKELLISNWKEPEYQPPQNAKYKEIRFITCSHSKGNTEIIVQPYYLKSKKNWVFI